MMSGFFSINAQASVYGEVELGFELGSTFYLGWLALHVF